MRISDWSSDVCSSDRRLCDQSDVETASGRIANIADQPISSLSTALGQITAADSLGIVGEAFGDFAGGAVHHGAPQAALRAESRPIGNRSSRRPSTSAPTAPVGTSGLRFNEKTPHTNTTALNRPTPPP